MAVLQTLGLALGASFASGLNLYATVAVLGLLQHFQATCLPLPLSGLGHPIVIAVALALYAIEFFFDKIPYVDNVWNAFHTFIRPPAAALLSYGAFASFPEEWRVLGALLGGGIALSSHGTKMAVRTAATVSPEPFSNIVLSLGEDGVTAVLTWMATAHPIFTTVVVAVLTGISVYLMVKLYGALRRSLRGLFRVFRPSSTHMR